jgi:AraC-like DNA-binding protein
MARSTFAQEFHSCLGQPPIHYLAQWRMQVAASDLSAGIPANVVSEKLGYASPASFARVFSRVYGMNPGNYRRKEIRRDRDRRAARRRRKDLSDDARGDEVS